MRALALSTFAAIVFWAMRPAAADPVLFQPEGCDFQLSFPANPNVTQQKSTTDRGDIVITNRADLHLDQDGKPGLLRAECTRVTHMGFVDPEILKNNMKNMGDAYKLQNAIVAVESSPLAGPVGRLEGKAKLGGKDIALRILRYTGPNSIFDVWIGADPDGFPTDADTTFLKSIELNRRDIP